MWRKIVLSRGKEVAAREEREAPAAAISKYLSRYALFEGLSLSQLADLASAIQAKAFQDEEIVCHSPDAFHDALILGEGTVAVTKKRGDSLHVLHLEKMGPSSALDPWLAWTKWTPGSGH